MKKNILLYIFFILLSSMTILDICKSDKSFSEIENRNLKTKVDFSIKKYINGSFQNQYESYISDQFVLRDNWINIKSLCEYSLGKKENNNILYGEENYLFEKYTSIDSHRVDVNIDSINKLSQNINNNITTIIVPNSYEIYEEYVPDFAPLIDIEGELKDIYERLNLTNNINMIDEFKESKEINLFYKTDHHWTIDGAYLTYKSFMESLNKEYINIYDYNKNTVENFYGTYYSKAKPYNIPSDKFSYYDFNDITMSINQEEFNGLYDYSKLDIRDKYSFFLYGNNSLTIIKNNKIKNDEKLIVFKDSYANSMIPFLTQNYKEIHVIDLRTFNLSVSDYINENDFDDVLILYNFISFCRDADVLKLKS